MEGVKRVGRKRERENGRKEGKKEEKEERSERGRFIMYR